MNLPNRSLGYKGDGITVFCDAVIVHAVTDESLVTGFKQPERYVRTTQFKVRVLTYHISTT